MMHTWSLVGVFDKLRLLERLTRPPRMGHDVDLPVDGAEEEVREPPEDVLGHCGECGGLEWISALNESHQCRECAHEPPLDDDELIGVRGLLQERYGSDSSVVAGPAAEPAGGLTHSPVVPPAGPQLAQWLEPAIRTVLADHISHGCRCSCEESLWGIDTWHEHVAPLIAAHIARALPDYPGQIRQPMESGADMGARVDMACDLFEQHKRGQR